MKGLKVAGRARRCLCKPDAVRLLAERHMALAAAKPAEKVERMAQLSDSFTMNMFRGQIDPTHVFPFPEPLTAEQKQTLAELVPPLERFFEEVNNPAKNDAESKVEESTMKGLWDLGLFGLQVPEEYGGLGLSNMQYARVTEVAGSHDLGVSITLGAHQSIGFKAILLYGTPEQRAKYLPRVTNGEIAAFCLTDSTAGSDAASIKARAVLSPDGKHYILNGSKIWISNGGIADIFTVFAQTPIEKNGKVVEKMTAFIVERSFGGLTSGPPEKKMGIKCSNTAELYFEDVPIPVENVLGRVGEGFKVAMNVLNNGRFGMAAALGGTQRAALKQAAEHAASRVQFGKKLAEFPGMQEKLARMAMRQYVTESLAYLVSGIMDAGGKEYQLEAAVSKVFASEAAWTSVDEAIQILGGMGYMTSAGLERVLRDLRIFRIFEGANDILRLFIALTGIQYAGSHLQELQRAFRNPAANLGLIVSETGKRAGRAVGLARPAPLQDHVASELRSPAQQLARRVLQFGDCVETALRKYGRGVVNEQLVLNRMANAVIDATTTAAVLSRASRAVRLGLPSAAHELQLAEAWADEATERMGTLEEVFSARTQAHNERLTAIGRAVAAAGGQPTLNPLEI